MCLAGTRCSRSHPALPYTRRVCIQSNPCHYHQQYSPLDKRSPTARHSLGGKWCLLHRPSNVLIHGLACTYPLRTANKDPREVRTSLPHTSGHNPLVMCSPAVTSALQDNRGNCPLARTFPIRRQCKAHLRLPRTRVYTCSWSEPSFQGATRSPRGRTDIVQSLLRSICLLRK